MPSRIRSLLTEFLEVLLLVIQPLSNVSGMYVNPNTLKSQIQEHSAQAAYFRSIFDPALIEQELKHELFDPSGLFSAIGAILKGHCAPMRDRAVEAMVQVAQTCSPKGTGGKRDAVIALRMCLEILELMKLVQVIFFITYTTRYSIPLTFSRTLQTINSRCYDHFSCALRDSLSSRHSKLVRSAR